MIIIKLQGGLGNQMFQYACGKSVGLQKRTSVKLDISTLKEGVQSKHFSVRSFELNIFKATLYHASDKELNLFFLKSIHLKIWYKWLKSNRFYTEPHFFWDKNLTTIRGNLFLNGFWQSEKYFAEFEKNIRDDFTFIADRNQKTMDKENEILLCNAISIHVRRGDYISSPTANSFHGVNSLEYYETAMSKIEVLIDNPFYFLFSDDVLWAKEHLAKNRQNITIIEHNKGKDSWQDMYLMSKCKHHIIANSSFSWWGAWLNKNVNKVVIAPKKWFANKEKNNQTQDLIPTSWIRL